MLLITGLFVLVFALTTISESKRVLKDEANRFITHSAQLLERPLWYIESSSVQAILQTISREQRVICIRLESVLGPNEFDFSSECPTLTENTYITKHSILHETDLETDTLGKLEIHFDLSPDEELLTSNIITQLLLLSLLSGTLIVMVFFGFGITIIKPIRRVMDSIETFEKTGRREYFDWQTEDELGQFIQAYNSIQRLQEKFEKNLQDQLSFQRTLLNGIPSPIVYVNKNKNIVDCNPSFNDLVHIEKLQVINQPISQIIQDFNTEKLLGTTQIRGELTVSSHLGKNTGTIGMTLMHSSAPLLDSQGSIQGHVIVLQDISERKQSEAKILDARERAEKALSDLELAQDTLVQTEKLASLGRLVAGVAHEINTPIGSSVTVSSALLDRAKVFRDEFEHGQLKKSSLTTFIEGVEEASSLLNSSLTSAVHLVQNFKQVAADQTSSQRRNFNLKIVLEEVISTLAPRLKHTKHSISIDIDKGIMLDSYPGPLGQVVTNFFTNAINHAFTDDQAGTMLVNAKLLPDDMIEIVFEDNGKGIPAEHQKKVFDPFFTTKMGEGGTGLGLNLVHNITVKILGGSLTLESKDHHGTKFIVTIPKVAPLSDEAQG
jgi:PAS domain S-box-containing protein